MPILSRMCSVLTIATAAVIPAVAFGQSGLIQSQTQSTTGAVQSQIREAVRPQMQISNSAGAITGLALSADGSLLAIAPSDHTVRVWDLQNGVQQARPAGPDALSPAGLAAIGLGNNPLIAVATGPGDRLTIADPQTGAVV